MKIKCIKDLPGVKKGTVAECGGSLFPTSLCSFYSWEIMPEYFQAPLSYRIKKRIMDFSCKMGWHGLIFKGAEGTFKRALSLYQCGHCKVWMYFVKK